MKIQKNIFMGGSVRGVSSGWGGGAVQGGCEQRIDFFFFFFFKSGGGGGQGVFGLGRGGSGWM